MTILNFSLRIGIECLVNLRFKLSTMEKKTNAQRAGLLILIVLILMFASSFVMMFIPGIFSEQNLMNMYVVNALLVSIISILLPAVLFMVRSKEGDFHLKRAPISQVLLAVLMGIGVFFIAAGVNTVFNELFTLTGADTSSSSTPMPEMGGVLQLVLCLLLIAVIPALCEETLFRGALLYSWRGLGRVRAVALTSVLFALLHFSIPSFPALFLIGAVLGILAYDSRSIWPSVIVHFTNNAMSVLYTFLITPNAGTGTEVEIMWPMIFAAAAFFIQFGAIFFVPAFILYRRSVRKRMSTEIEVVDAADAADVEPVPVKMPKVYIIIVIAIMLQVALLNALMMYLPAIL